MKLFEIKDFQFIVEFKLYESPAVAVWYVVIVKQAFPRNRVITVGFYNGISIYEQTIFSKMNLIVIP